MSGTIARRVGRPFVEASVLVLEARDAIASWVRLHPRLLAGTVAGLVVLYLGLMVLIHWVATDVPIDGCIFGADSRELLLGISDASILGSRGDLTKHLPQTLGFTAAAAGFQAMGLSAVWAVSAAMALAGTLGAVTIFGASCTFGRSRWAGGLAVALAFSSFGGLFSLALVETYGMTLALLGLAMWVIALVRDRVDLPWGAAVWVGVVVGLAGLAHLPAFAVIAFYGVICLGQQDPSALRNALYQIAIAAGLALALISVPHIVMVVVTGKVWVTENAALWASVTNFARPVRIADVMTTIFAFSWVSPMAQASAHYYATDLRELASRPLALLALLGIITIMPRALFTLYRNRDTRKVFIGYATYMTVMVIFHIYYNPYETMLYSALWIVPTAVMAGAAVARFRDLTAHAAIVCLLTASINVPLAIWRLPDAARCAQRPVPQELLEQQELSKSSIRSSLSRF